MNALLLRNLGGMRRVTSLQSFSDYRKSEKENPQLSSVTSEGVLQLMSFVDSPPVSTGSCSVLQRRSLSSCSVVP